RVTTSDTQGFYTCANVAPAEYLVRVESPTFAKTEIKDVRLEVGHASTVDVKLALARVGEIVTVQAGEVQVESTQSEVQGLVTAPTIENIPLNGRNFLELAFLIPGNRPPPTSTRPRPTRWRYHLRGLLGVAATSPSMVETIMMRWWAVR